MNILAANGREIVLGPGIPPRWHTTDLTQPVELTPSWVWRPGETVKPYNCVEPRRPAR